MNDDPLMDEGLRKWITKTSHANYWRFSGYEPQDLIQEGYYCFVKCKAKYSHNFSTPPSKDDQKWFMSLVKTSFSNHITSLIRKQMRLPYLVSENVQVAGEESTNSYADSLNVDPGMSGFVDIMLSSPAEVLEIFHKILVEGHDVLSAKRKEAFRLKLEGPRRRRVRYIETTNEQLCKLVGVDPKEKNFHREILNLLKRA